MNKHSNPLIDLAKAEFSDLNAIDEHLFECVSKGTECHFINAPALKADRISWLCNSNKSQFLTHRGIVIYGAKIIGTLNLTDVELRGRLALVQCHFEKNIILIGASLGGLVLNRSSTRSIQADGVSVDGDVAIRTANCLGQLRFVGATIGGDFECNESTIIADDGVAVDLTRANISGHTLMAYGCLIQGQLVLSGANLSGSLVFQEGTFKNPGKDSITAERAIIKGDLVFNEAMLHGRAYFAAAVIGGTLQWRHLKKCDETQLDLRSAKVAILLDSKQDWPKPGNLALNGFVYGSIGDQAPTDAESRIQWIKLQPPREGFKPQPYEQLARVLIQSGHEDEAREIQIAKNRERKIYSSPIRKTYLSILEFLVGYGYRPWRAFYLSLVVILIGWIVFALGAERGLMINSGDSVHTNEWFAPLSSMDHPKFYPLIYSAENFIPLVRLGEADSWKILRNHRTEFHLERLDVPIPSDLLRWYLWLHIILGWVLTTFWVAGLTGAIRR